MSTRGLYRGFTRRSSDELWRPPRQLARAENSGVSQSGITTETDVTGCSISFAVTDYPVKVRGYIPFPYGSTAGTVLLLKITDENNVEKSSMVGAAPSVNTGALPMVEEEIVVPGVYSRKLRLTNNTVGGSISTFVASTYIEWIEAQEFVR